MNKSFQHQRMGCVCTARTEQSGHCRALSQFLVGNELEIQAHGCELAPRPRMERERALRAGGAAACQVTASCWYILLSSIMMWWPPLMKCMLSAGGLENKCSSAAREVAGLESGMNANQTFASAALSALAAVDSHPPEASPAVLMTPLSARSSSSFPLLFFPFAFSICS